MVDIIPSTVIALVLDNHSDFDEFCGKVQLLRLGRNSYWI